MGQDANEGLMQADGFGSGCGEAVLNEEGLRYHVNHGGDVVLLDGFDGSLDRAVQFLPLARNAEGTLKVPGNHALSLKRAAQCKDGEVGAHAVDLVCRERPKMQDNQGKGKHAPADATIDRRRQRHRHQGR